MHYYALLFQITPSVVAKIDFRRPKRIADETPTDTRPPKRHSGQQISDIEEDRLFTGLKAIAPTAAVLSSIMPIESATSTSMSTVRKLPPLLTSLCNRENLLLNRSELKVLCEDTFQNLSISTEEAVYLEESTRMQSQSLLWFKHRTGRITASKFHAVRFTSLTSPSISLINSIMKKQNISSKIPALQWGINNEDVARDAYLTATKDSHVGLQCTQSGLHVNTDYPHLGASPDGIITCECCGEGLLEIKCPYKYRDVDPNNITDQSFYLKRNEQGEIVGLSHGHEYYYQVQGQLALCVKDFCDFVCWTPKGIYVERILRDKPFFDELKLFLDNYFVNIILPILLTGKTEVLETLAHATSGDSDVDSLNSDDEAFCKCGGPDEGWMIACDNPTCAIEWFHYKCVGITRKPKGKWFCSDNCKKSFIDHEN